MVVRHLEAEARLTVYRDGEALPRQKAVSQRFRLVADRLVPEAITEIVSPRSDSHIVMRPDITGTGVPGRTVTVSAVTQAAPWVLGTARVDGQGAWKLTVPPAKELPVGRLTLTAVMTDDPGSTTARVNVTVVKVPPARLEIAATTQRVTELRPPSTTRPTRHRLLGDRARR